MNLPHPARRLWNSQSQIGICITNTKCEVYYDLLYNSGMYEEVLKEFQERHYVFKYSQKCLLVGKYI